MSERGIFATNLEKLLLYSLDDKNGVNDDCKKMIVKIYDHFQLALHQIENVNNIFANSIEEAKENLQKQIKRIYFHTWYIRCNCIGICWRNNIFNIRSAEYFCGKRI